MIDVALEGQGAGDLARSRGRRCGQNAGLTPFLVALRPNSPTAPTTEKEENMNTFATDCEVGHGVEKAAAPLTAPVCLALMPAITAGPGRLATAQQALPHPMAHPGGSPAARGPARRAGRGAGSAMPSPAGADGVSDHVLLGGFATGDANTGTAFVRRFQGRVYGVAINILGDRGLAEEVAQEAFVRAWRYADAYDPERASVATWLLRITRNLAIDALRRRRPLALDPEMVAALAPAGRHRCGRRHRHIRAGRPGPGCAYPPPSRASQGRLAGRLLRPHRPRGRRVRGHPPRDGQEPYRSRPAGPASRAHLF